MMQGLQENLHLLNDKLLEPCLPDVLVPRGALARRLEEHDAAGKRMIVLQAPAGCGKTVSAALWLRNSGRRPVWISLDAYDNTPAVFYRLLCTGLLSAAQEANPAQEEILGSRTFSSAPEEHAIRFLSEMRPDSTPRALILDDTHHLASPGLLETLPLVLKRLPLSYITVVLSRRDMDAALAPRPADGRVACLSAGGLAFSSGEIQKLFGAHGHFITHSEAEEVLEATGGWAMGVGALAAGGAARAAGAARLLFGYIRAQLWEQWPAELRDFMLRTAVADTMEVELCRKLSGREDAGRMLEALCAVNPFLIRTDDGCFRYHHLFLDFLRDRWQAEPVPLAELNRQASAFYCAREEFLLARRYALESGDMPTIADVIHRSLQYPSLSLDEYVAFWKAFDQDSLPETLCDQHPFLYGPLAWFQYLRGDCIKMARYLDRLQTRLPVIVSRYPQFLESSLLILHLDFRIPFAQQIAQFSQLPAPGIRHHAPQALTLTLQMPLLHRSNRDYSELADPALAERAYETFGAFLKECRPVALRCVASGLLLEQGRIREAAAQILQDQPDSLAGLPAEMAFSLCAHHIVAELAGGGEWQGWTRQMEQLVEENEARCLRPNFLAFRTRIRLLFADADAAREWLDNYAGEQEWPELYRLYQHLTAARAYILLGLTDSAMALLKKISALTAGFRRTLDWAEAGVLTAALDWAAGRQEEALRCLGELVRETQANGFVTVIAAEGAAILPPLKRLAARVRRGDNPDGLDSAFLHEAVIAATRYARRYRSYADSLRSRCINLSRRQAEVLGLRAKGLQNLEIAEALGLSLHTVKAHLAVAYEKLEVNRAVDAVVRARELGLLK